MRTVSTNEWIRGGFPLRLLGTRIHKEMHVGLIQLIPIMDLLSIVKQYWSLDLLGYHAEIESYWERQSFLLL